MRGHEVEGCPRNSRHVVGITAQQ